MPRFFRHLVVVLVVAACGGGDGASTTTSEPESVLAPVETVEAFFTAVSGGDFSEAARFVDGTQVALLVGAIEGTSMDEAVTMLEDGTADDVAATFWRNFVDSIPAYSDQTAAEITVGTYTGDADFPEGHQPVSVGFEGQTTDATWIVAGNTDGWRIDLFATLGPAFAPNLAIWLDGAAGIPPTVADAVSSQMAGLEVGLDVEPLGPIDRDTRTTARSLITRFG